MTQQQSNSNRIAKNTLFLYIRMAVLMFISLFTARVLLDKLGAVDYGIYNVVGGLAVMFTFFSSSLTNATQRFLNIELGRNNRERASLIVKQHFTLYLVICAAVIVAAETVGLLFVCRKLVIPPERLTAAIWVFQFMVLSLCVTLIGIIFNSQVIAHEDMGIYSYMGIFEGVSKLLICYAVAVTSADRLIVYALLLFAVNVAVQGFYACYCFRHYDETRLGFVWNRPLLRETGSMIGWNTVGTFVYAVNDTGVNLLLNIFCGPVVNAARAVSFQVSTALNNFSTNFFTSVRPQITKSYAAGDWDYLYKLFYQSTKYSYYLLWIFCLPVALSIESLLAAWLKAVPAYTGVFTVWVLAYALVNVINNPIWALALSVGKLSRYIGIGSIVLLMTFPLAYAALRMGKSPVSVFVIMVLVRVVYTAVVLRIVHDYVNYSYREYFSRVLRPIALVSIVSLALSVPLHWLTGTGIIASIAFCALSIILTGGVIWLIGIDRSEREFVTAAIRKKLHR